MDIPEHDVIVVGAGNAATCAALSAAENGASVLQLEISPEHWRGGNSAFTGGAFRVVYHGFDDLAQLIPDINDHELHNVVVIVFGLRKLSCFVVTESGCKYLLGKD